MKIPCQIVFMAALTTVIASGKASTISPEELYSRMRQNADVQLDSSRGTFLVKFINPQKTLNSESREIIEKSITQMRNQEAAKGPSAAAAFERDVGDIRKQLQSAYELNEFTYLETLTTKGKKTRSDRIPLENKPLAQFANDPKIKDQPAATRLVWDGNRAFQVDAAQQIQGPDAANHLVADRLMILSSPPGLMDFTKMGREVPAVDLVAKYKSQNLPVSVSAVNTDDGENGLMLQLGAKGTIGVYIECIVLPQKGYAIHSTKMIMGGQVVSDEKYTDYVETQAGIWIPRHALKRSHTVSPTGVVALSSVMETVAMSKIEVNQPVDDSIFEFVPVKDTMVFDQRNGKGFLIPGSKSSQIMPVNLDQLISDPQPTVPSVARPNLPVVSTETEPSPRPLNHVGWSDLWRRFGFVGPLTMIVAFVVVKLVIGRKKNVEQKS